MLSTGDEGRNPGLVLRAEMSGVVHPAGPAEYQTVNIRQEKVFYSFD